MRGLLRMIRRKPGRALAVVVLSIACIQVGPQYVPALVSQLDAFAAAP